MDNPLFWSKPSLGKRFQVDTGGTLTTGLVAYYKMEDSTDYWSTYNGTATNVTFSAGKVNNAGNFPGNGYINLSGTSGFNFDSYTVSGWIYLNADVGTGSPSILSKGYGSGNEPFEIGFSGEKQFLFYAYGMSNPLYLGVLNTLTWYHFIFSWTYGGTAYGYLNNSLINSVSCPAKTTNSYNLFMGAFNNQGTPARYLNAKIDELCIYNKILTEQARTDLYNSGNGQTMIS